MLLLWNSSIDIWTADNMSIDISTSRRRQSKSVTRTLVANEWNSFDIPLSEFTSQGLPLNNVGQFMFVGTPSAAGTVLLITFIFL
jgi:hypothetical protein